MDLYALGCVLYELLAGEPPFANGSIELVLTQQLIADPPRLPAHVPDELAVLVDALLAKSPEARPASAAGVAAQLRAILGPTAALDMDESTTLVAPPKRPTPPQHLTPPKRPTPPHPVEARPPIATRGVSAVVLALAFLIAACVVVVLATR
jgi:serine/threonine-protein kinase